MVLRSAAHQNLPPSGGEPAGTVANGRVKGALIPCLLCQLGQRHQLGSGDRRQLGIGAGQSLYQFLRQHLIALR